jgi:hypothetical protein
MRSSLTFALSSAVLLFAAGQAHAQAPRTYVVRSAVVTIASATQGEAQVLCNGSDFATGGGLATASNVEPEGTTVGSFPISDATGVAAVSGAAPRGWRMIVWNPSLESLDIETFVVCLTTAADLTVNAAGTGSGTVSSSDGAIRCPGVCTATYDSGTSVTLTATPGSGSILGGWNGCDTVSDTTCTVTMSVARSVMATFNVP